MEAFFGPLLLLLLSLRECLAFSSEDFAALPSCSQGFALPSAETESLATRGLLDCLRMCSLEASCLAVNACATSGSGASCQLLTTLTDNCTQLAARPGCTYVHKTCNYGTKDSLTGRCVCLLGYAGPYCERHIRDCVEGLEMGSTGQHPNVLIQPLGAPRPFNVYCIFAHGGVTVLLRRTKNCPDPLGIFSQPWSVLQRDLGDCACNCFSGLENMYHLVKQRRSRMKINFRYDSWASKSHINYPDVQMANESSRYALTFDTPYCNSPPYADDAFLPGRNRKFCTSDNDCAGCAAAAGHAGWFDDQNGAPCPEVQGLGDPMQWPVEGTQRDLDLFALEVIPL